MLEVLKTNKYLSEAPLDENVFMKKERRFMSTDHKRSVAATSMRHRKAKNARNKSQLEQSSRDDNSLHKDYAFASISRSKRNLVMGAKQAGPPLGTYSPKYNLITPKVHSPTTLLNVKRCQRRTNTALASPVRESSMNRTRVLDASYNRDIAEGRF